MLVWANRKCLRLLDALTKARIVFPRVNTEFLTQVVDYYFFSLNFLCKHGAHCYCSSYEVYVKRNTKVWRNNTGGWERYSLILPITSWQPWSYCGLKPFFNFLKMGPRTMVNLDIKQLIYCKRPKKLCISFSVLGGGVSWMTLIFEGLTSISLRLTTYPSSLPEVTPKCTFY